MPFVLDASVTASWAFDDESSPATNSILVQLDDDKAFVPSLWWYEVRNLLLTNERRKRITEAGTAAFLRDLARLAIVVDHTPDEMEVLRLARKHRLSVYDACYLELAERKEVALATFDKDLLRAARADAVPLLPKKL